MEYIEGDSLSDYISRHDPMPEQIDFIESYYAVNSRN